LTYLPIGKRSVGFKWPLNLKYKADETIEQYKACLFAKGYTQTHSTDYVEMFVLT